MPTMQQYNVPTAAGAAPNQAVGNYMANYFTTDQIRQQLQQMGIFPSEQNIAAAMAGQLPGVGSAAGGAAGGAGGSGGQGGLSGNPFADAFAQAQRANQQRYDQGLTGLADRYDRNMNRLATSSRQDEEDIRTQYGRRAAAGEQDLSARGLGNSTLLGTMRQGLAREETGALNRARDARVGRDVATDASLSGDVFNWIRDKEDAYPDMNMLAQLAFQAGQNGVGGGGAGGSIAGGNSPAVNAGGFDYMPLSGMGYNVPSAAAMSRPNWFPTPNVQGGNGSGGQNPFRPVQGGSLANAPGNMSLANEPISGPSFFNGNINLSGSNPFNQPSGLLSGGSQNTPLFDMGAGNDSRPLTQADIATGGPAPQQQGQSGYMGSFFPGSSGYFPNGIGAPPSASGHAGYTPPTPPRPQQPYQPNGNFFADNLPFFNPMSYAPLIYPNMNALRGR